jgi:hypothetical protein
LANLRVLGIERAMQSFGCGSPAPCLGVKIYHAVRAARAGLTAAAKIILGWTTKATGVCPSGAIALKKLALKP